jgi:hypothetical protein
VAKTFVSKIVVPPPRGQGMLTRWSYSTWSSYEKCPYQVFLKQVERAPEVGDRSALERGIAVHKILEDIVNGTKSIDALNEETPGKPTKLPTWKAEVETLLDAGATAEDSFALSQSWTPTTWNAPDVWLRGKLDARALPKIIDYKTGQVYPDHVYQAELYAVAEFARGAQHEEIAVEFWYLDNDAEKSKNAKKTWTFKLEDQPQRIAAWEHRTEAMLNDTVFPKRPGMHCKWCGYAKSRGGTCEAG